MKRTQLSASAVAVDGGRLVAGRRPDASASSGRGCAGTGIARRSTASRVTTSASKRGGLALDPRTSREVERARRDVGKSRAQAAHGHDAAGRRAAPRAGGTRRRSSPALEAPLDRAAAARPDPGAPALHRLNRAEYGNAIRDLLALDVDVARCCRRTTRRPASTTSPTCSASRRR